MPRLTKEARQGFIEAVGARLPALPRPRDFFNEAAERARATVEACLPEDVRGMVERRPEVIERRGNASVNFVRDDQTLLEKRYAYHAWGVTFTWCKPVDGEPHEDVVKSARAVLLAEVSEYLTALRQRQELLSRLREVANACSTVEGLSAALPAFAELIPDIAPPTKKQLPVAASQLVADFLKAGAAL